MFKRFFQHFYFLRWYLACRIFGKRKPLQTVLFIGDKCNLRCRHCSVIRGGWKIEKKWEQIESELKRSWRNGSRFVDFEGGEPFLWRDGDKTVNDLFDLARKIGFFTTTVTTNAQLPFEPCRSDLVWVSLDGIGRYHDAVRGEGAFEKLEKNVALSTHSCLNANMAINKLNVENVEETIRYIAAHPKFHLISLNFHTPYPETEELALDAETRCRTIDLILALKKKGAPVMNSAGALKRMKSMKFQKVCWMTDFVMVNGDYFRACPNFETDLCAKCGFCMSAEMNGIWNLRPGTILAGLKVRM